MIKLKCCKKCKQRGRGINKANGHICEACRHENQRWGKRVHTSRPAMGSWADIHEKKY